MIFSPIWDSFFIERSYICLHVILKMLLFLLIYFQENFKIFMCQEHFFLIFLST